MTKRSVLFILHALTLNFDSFRRSHHHGHQPHELETGMSPSSVGSLSSSYGSSFGSDSIPNFQHPSHMLLKDNGFVQLVYSKYHHKCLKGEFLVIVNASLSPSPPVVVKPFQSTIAGFTSFVRRQFFNLLLRCLRRRSGI